VTGRRVASIGPVDRPVDRAVDTAVAERAAAVIGAVVERVFRSVTAVQAFTLESYRAARDRGEPLRDRDISAMREPLTDLLGREREIVVGMGVIVSPGLLSDRALRLEWWQCDRDRPEPVRLEVDLNPHSVGFYDYAAAEWFAAPRRTGRRHVVGPYVDVHGTDRYLLTLTVPVIADGRFLGVAGADVPVAWFESLVLRELDDLTADVVVVNPDDRVVLSTSARWLAGSLVPADRAGTPPGARTVAIPDPQWRVMVTAAVRRAVQREPDAAGAIGIRRP
jgi:Cache domain